MGARGLPTGVVGFLLGVVVACYFIFNKDGGVSSAEMPPAYCKPDHPSNYTFDADTVADSHTGLTWQRVPSADTYTWADAKAYCADLRLAGTAPWRLPTVRELNSIIDNTVANPAINATAFPNTPEAGYFWSASPFANNSDYAWFVLFNYGYTSGSVVDYSYSVRCVR